MPRETKQKQAIRKVLDDADHPLTPQEICKRAARHTPRLGIATVYRMLQRMTHDKQAVCVEIAGQPPHYELADKEHHHHFVCTRCHQVFDFHGCCLGNLKSLVPKNFHIDSHEITLYGSCPKCCK